MTEKLPAEWAFLVRAIGKEARLSGTRLMDPGDDPDFELGETLLAGRSYDSTFSAWGVKYATRLDQPPESLISWEQVAAAADEFGIILNLVLIGATDEWAVRSTVESGVVPGTTFIAPYEGLGWAVAASLNNAIRWILASREGRDEKT